MTFKINEVILGDSIELLRTIPPCVFDLCLTDPPYGIDFKQNCGTERLTKDGIENDEKENYAFLKTIVREIHRTLREDSHLYFFTRWDKLDLHIPLLSEFFKLKNLLIWEKDGFGLGDLEGAYATNYECILFATKGRKKLNEIEGNARHPSILRYNNVNPNFKLHNHEKPTSLLRFLIEKSSNQNDIILDPFCGSGSTAEASLSCGRRFFTCELVPDIHRLASERIKTFLTLRSESKIKKGLFDFSEEKQ